MSLYFGDFVTTVTTLMIFAAVVFIICTAAGHRKVEFWGRRIAMLGLFGLVLCCFAATRDNYHLSVQSAMDPNVAAGLFAVDSIQSLLGCIGGAVIAISSISSIFVKNQKYRKVMFFVLGAAVIAKIIIIEISRWVV